MKKPRTIKLLNGLIFKYSPSAGMDDADDIIVYTPNGYGHPICWGELDTVIRWLERAREYERQ